MGRGQRQTGIQGRIDLGDRLQAIADEYLAYTTDSLIEIITQSRKFRLELVLGSQEVISGGGAS